MMANPLVRYPARIVFPALLLVLAVAAVAVHHRWTEQNFLGAVQAEEMLLLREHLYPVHAGLERELEADSQVNLQRRILGLALHEGVTDAWLVDGNQRIGASLARLQLGRPLPEILETASPSTRRRVTETLAVAPKNLTVEAIPGETALLGRLGIGNQHNLLVRLDYASSLARRSLQRQGTQVAFATLLLAGILLLALLLHFLLFRRTARLTAALERIAAGQLDAPIALEGRDELARIAGAANAMASKLKEQLAQLAKLSHLIERSPVVAMTWRNEPGWPVSYVSDNVRQWGYKADDFLVTGLAYADLIHGDDIESVRQEVVQHLEHGPDEFNQEYRLRHGDGGWIWLDDRTQLERDTSGAVIGISGVLLDITERKVAELVLADQSQRLNLVIEATGLGTFDFDLVTGVAVSNTEYACLLGHDPSTFRESPERWISNVHPADAERTAELRNSLLTGGLVDDSWDLRVRCADGTWKWTQTSCRITETDSDGRPLRLLGTVQDIQVRKEAEQDKARQVRRSEVLLSLPELADMLPETEFLQRVLDLAEELTQSQIGFVHFVHDEERSIELVAWSHRTVAEYRQPASAKHYPMDQAGVWADAVRQRKAIIINDYAGYPHKHGLPEGHARLDRLISVPAIEDGRVVLVAGVGNKAEDYHHEDVQTVLLLAQAAHRLVQRRRSTLRLAQFHRVMQRSVNEIYLLDTTTGRFLEVNEGARRNLGFSVEELHGMGPADIAEDAQPHSFNNQVELLRRREVPSIRFSARHRRKDGTHYCAELQMELTDDEPPQALAVGLDVTERRHLESEMRKLALVVDQSPESIVVTQLDGTIDYVNPAFEAISGYARSELVGRNPRVLQSGSTPAATFAQMWATLAAGQPWSGEFINRRKDGSDYIEHAFVAPLKQADGSVSHYVAVKEDITEKVRLTQELDRHRNHLEDLVQERTAELAVARDRAEAATRAKGAFLANMSHEIRTPMNAILGMTYLLLRGEVGEEQRGRLQRISDAGHHLLALINDILDLSRIDAGKLHVERAPIDAAAIGPGVVAMLADQAALKGLPLILDADPVPEGLLGDAVRLNQVLVNLVGNAIKFTNAGRIVVRVRVLDQDALSAHLRFEVEDTGIGIDASALTRLFRPFEQGDSSTTRKHGGTGLGLAITSQLVELMGGSMGAESSLGQGSLFWFTVQLATDTAGLRPLRGEAPADVASFAAHHSQGRRVLIAEDDPINQEVALGLLHQLGMVVEQAKNGAQAVELFRAAPFDLVLMDIQMPEMDGFTATRILRTLPGGEAVPILAMTANVMPEDRARCLACGMSDFVAKPVDPEYFYRIVAQWLRQPLATPQAQPAAAPISAPTSNLREVMSKLGEQAWEEGFARVRGNTALYVRMLRVFSREHHKDLARLALACEPDQAEDLRQLAHCLKGAAATLGLQRLREAATALESQASRAKRQQPEDRAVLEEHAATLTQELLLHFGAFAELSDSALVASAPELKLPQVQKILQEMQALLQSHDAEVLGLFHHSLGQLAGLPQPDLALLQQLIDGFEFRGALAVVQRLRVEYALLGATDAMPAR